MPRLRLAAADRERLGCPEFLPLDVLSVTNREALVLRDLGYPTPVLWRRALRTPTVKSDDGDYIQVDYQAWTAMVWLSLRRAGVETDPSTLEFDSNFEYLADPDPVEPAAVESGKAPARAPSTSSARKRSTGGATSKRKSTPTA